MSANRVPFVFKTMFFIADGLSFGVIALSLYCYAFDITDKSGYALDGVAAAASVVAGVFGLIANNFNKRECIRMHS